MGYVSNVDNNSKDILDKIHNVKFTILSTIYFILVLQNTCTIKVLGLEIEYLFRVPRNWETPKCRSFQ